MGYEIRVDRITSPTQREGYRKGLGAFEGVVAHSTATPEAPAENIRKFEQNNYEKGYVHYAVDWKEIVEIWPVTYRAAGAGKIANYRYVHVELCETSDPIKFLQSYKRYTWLIAKILYSKRLGVSDGGSLVSHDWVSRNLGGTTHVDPLGYLKSHGISWNEFVQDVKAEYELLGMPVKKAEEGGNKPMEITAGDYGRLGDGYKKMREAGFISSDTWEKLAYEQKLTADQAVYVQGVALGGISDAIKKLNSGQ